MIELKEGSSPYCRQNRYKFVLWIMGVSRSGSETSRVLAERLTGLRAARQIITQDPEESVRWSTHDYPSPLARWNYHPEIEIHLIRRSQGRFIVGDFVGTFQAGHLSIVGSGLPHDWVSNLEEGETVNDRDVVIQIDPAWLSSGTQFMPELKEIQPLLVQAARGVEFSGYTSRAAADVMEIMGAATGLERLKAFFELLTLLARSPLTERKALATEFFQPQLDDQAAAVVDLVLEYAFSGHTGNISMAEAASQVGMSEPTFSRYFKRATGQNFSELIRKLRVAHAKRLLRETDLPIAAVCFEVGFNNLSNFNRQFLRETRATPRQFRSNQ